MNSPNDDALLREILADHNLAAVRSASLHHSLLLIRRRRRARHALQLGVALLLSAWAASTFLPRHPRQSLVAAMPTNRPAVSPKPPPEPVVKPITDEELLALFPDRAVVLIGKPGQQEFVVLGAPAQN